MRGGKRPFWFYFFLPLESIHLYIDREGTGKHPPKGLIRMKRFFTAYSGYNSPPTDIVPPFVFDLLSRFFPSCVARLEVIQHPSIADRLEFRRGR
jgi:hypothetical protein